MLSIRFFFFQAEDGIRDLTVTGVQTCALPILYGIKQFEAVINPPQGMIMAIGAGEKRPYVVNDSLQIATVMSATGSFDHRAIDGADGARLMQVFKRLVEAPLGMLA